jgi:hypothetical protein
MYLNATVSKPKHVCRNVLERGRHDIKRKSYWYRQSIEELELVLGNDSNCILIHLLVHIIRSFAWEEVSLEQQAGCRVQ